MGWSPGFCMSNKAPDDVGLWSTLRVARLQTVTLWGKHTTMGLEGDGKLKVDQEGSLKELLIHSSSDPEGEKELAKGVVESKHSKRN